METRNCQNCKKDFTIEPDDFGFYEKMKVPPPTWCPECRMVRRLAWRNERNLFRRTDAHTGKDSFSGIPPESSIQTYETTYWYSDEWDALEYGVEYDFSRPFFEQFLELFKRVPIMAKSSAGFMINSDYCNEAGRLKNAYLCFDADFIEDSAYLVKVTNVKNSFDSHELIDDELCYECVMVYKSYQTFFSVDCESCVDVWFSKGLRGCTNCFGCVNLRGKSYYFFNEPLSKEEYERRIFEMNLSSYQSIVHIREKVLEFWQQFPVKYYHGTRNLNCTGDRISDSKNVRDSFSVENGENLRYVQISVLKAANSYDSCQLFMNIENAYECMTCGDGAYGLKCCFNSFGNVREIEYCGYCFGTSYCFGCVSMKKNKYCILNKQYSKEEYEILVPKIIQHMKDMPYVDEQGRVYTYGDFFPFSFSPLAYNESLAQDYVPIRKEEALDQGFTWREPSAKEFQTTLDGSGVPDLLQDVSDDITKEVIACENCKRAYRIIPAELQFYQRVGLPLPHTCHNCRFLNRLQFINQPKLFHRSCMCTQENHEHSGICQNKFETSYASDRPEIIYCESCYQKEVN